MRGGIFQQEEESRAVEPDRRPGTSAIRGLADRPSPRLPQAAPPITRIVAGSVRTAFGVPAKMISPRSIT